MPSAAFRARVVASTVAVTAACCLTAANARAIESDGPADATDAPSSAPGANCPLPPPVEAAPAAPSTVAHWFGWQTLLVDGASIGAGLAAASTGQGGTGAAVFVSGYLLGGPIVHWAHGQAALGFASLGLRIGAPLVLGVAGAKIGSGGHDYDSDDRSTLGAGVGILAGYVSAVVIDGALLSNEQVVPETPMDDDLPASAARPSETRSMFNWTPSFAIPRGGGATGGISGTF